MLFGDPEVDLLSRWVQSLLLELGVSFDADTQSRLLEACGKTCAAHHGSLAQAEALREQTNDLGQLLELLNRDISWCGTWQREKSTIVSVCSQCGCPLIRKGLLRLSPVLCACSTGFVKALFEQALGRPVPVYLEQAIGRGDPICRFIVYFEGAESAPTPGDSVH